jgi:hypothetical protein
MGRGNSKTPGEHALAAALTRQSGTTAFPRLPPVTGHGGDLLGSTRMDPEADIRSERAARNKGAGMF